MNITEDIVRQLTRLQSKVEGMVLQTVTLNNYEATAAPGVGDDSDDGYSVGSVWINTTADDAYICCDATVGAAVWKKTTP